MSDRLAESIAHLLIAVALASFVSFLVIELRGCAQYVHCVGSTKDAEACKRLE